MAGFSVAARLGVAFELDVTLSEDNEVVVIHDDRLDRTTSGSGFVDETPWADIAGLDAGSWWHDRFAGETVPRLADVLAALGREVVVDVEIKSPRGDRTVDEVAAATVAVIQEAGLTDRVVITSFNPYVLAAVRAADPSIARGQLTGTFEGSGLPWIQRVALRNLWLNKNAVPDMIVAESAFLTDRGYHYVQRMRRRGYRVVAWTVNEPDEMRRLLDLGVQGLITDRPDVALEVVAER